MKKAAFHDQIRINRTFAGMAASAGALSLFATFMAVVLVPYIVEYSKLHMDKRPVLMLAVETEFVLAIAICFAFMSFFEGSSADSDEKPRLGKQLKRAVATGLILLIVLAVFGMACGFVSGLIYRIMNQRLTYEQIKLVVDVIIGGMTLLFIPAVIIWTVSMTLNKDTFKEAALEGAIFIKAGYLNMLGLEAAAFAVFMPLAAAIHLTENMSGSVPRMIIYTITGSLITYVTYKKAARICSEK